MESVFASCHMQKIIWAGPMKRGAEVTALECACSEKTMKAISVFGKTRFYSLSLDRPSSGNQEAMHQ